MTFRNQHILRMVASVGRVDRRLVEERSEQGLLSVAQILVDMMMSQGSSMLRPPRSSLPSSLNYSNEPPVSPFQQSCFSSLPEFGENNVEDVDEGRGIDVNQSAQFIDARCVCHVMCAIM